METTFKCYIFVQTGRLSGRIEDPHLITSDVRELKSHQKAVMGGKEDARRHMLEILSGSSIEGMCLPDAIINHEEGTVRHFTEAREGQNLKGRRL